MYRQILLAYDGTLEGRLALREGARLAQTCGGQVTLLAVVDPGFGPGIGIDMVGAYLPPDDTAAYQKILDDGVARLTRLGLRHAARLEYGPPAERIAAVAREIAADLVVVGHRPQGLVAGWLLGSVTSDLTNSLTCSLLVARMEISDEVLFGTGQAASA